MKENAFNVHNNFVSFIVITSNVTKYEGKIGFIPTTSQVVICKKQSWSQVPRKRKLTDSDTLK